MLPGNLISFFTLTLASVAAGKSCRARRPGLSHSHIAGTSAPTATSKLPTVIESSSSTFSPSLAATTIATSVRAPVVSSPASTEGNAAAATETAVSSQPAPSSSKADSAATSTSPATAAETFIGLGTRYGGSCTEEDCWQDGACSFVDYELPSSIDGSTCVSEDIWNNGANCGGCISVSYKGKTITVMVTNLTGGNATHLDMTPDTWSKLTNGYSGGGVDDIEWHWITCPIAETTPLEIHMHAGASQYWFAATVQNARLRTSKLEVSSDEGSTWKSTTLDNYNMWTLDGTLSSNSAWVRVTSIEGDQVVIKDVALESGKVTSASENY